MKIFNSELFPWEYRGLHIIVKEHLSWFGISPVYLSFTCLMLVEILQSKALRQIKLAMYALREMRLLLHAWYQLMTTRRTLWYYWVSIIKEPLIEVSQPVYWKSHTIFWAWLSNVIVFQDAWESLSDYLVHFIRIKQSSSHPVHWVSQ